MQYYWKYHSFTSMSMTLSSHIIFHKTCVFFYFEFKNTLENHLMSSLYPSTSQKSWNFSVYSWFQRTRPIFVTDSAHIFQSDKSYYSSVFTHFSVIPVAWKLKRHRNALLIIQLLNELLVCFVFFLNDLRILHRTKIKRVDLPSKTVNKPCRFTNSHTDIQTVTEHIMFLLSSFTLLSLQNACLDNAYFLNIPYFKNKIFENDSI